MRLRSIRNGTTTLHLIKDTKLIMRNCKNQKSRLNKLKFELDCQVKEKEFLKNQQKELNTFENRNNEFKCMNYLLNMV
jgi:hypothetical protein